MSWEIVYSWEARSDLQNTYAYIAYTLAAPDTAAKLIRQILKEIRSLDSMPLRYALYDEEPWRSRGMRVLSVQRYLIFYVPIESTHTVRIVRVLYGQRDIRSQLRDISLD